MGAAVIAWTGAEMVQADDLLGQLGPLPVLIRLLMTAVVTICVVWLAPRSLSGGDCQVAGRDHRSCGNYAVHAYYPFWFGRST